MPALARFDQRRERSTRGLAGERGEVVDEHGQPIKVEVACDEACTVDASGTVKAKGKFDLKPVTLQLAAGQAATLKLKPDGGKAKRKLKKAKKAKATVDFTFTDGAGNSTPDQLKLKLKK